MTATGNPDVLQYQDVPDCVITKPNEIKVKLAAAGVNPVDTKIRRNGLLHGHALPAILGCDAAGTVMETGSSVTRFKTGDKVWFCHGGLGREQGNYAEYNIIDERWAASMPSRLSFPEAAALPLVLITAWGALFDRGGLQPGQSVLIHAGAGGVGHVAIQLAKLKGAKVITTVSDQKKADFVKALGADEVVFYTLEDMASAVLNLTRGKGVDLVIDTVGQSVVEQSIPVTAHYGRIVTLLALSGIDLNEARIRNLSIAFELMLTPMLRDLDDARAKHIQILNECANYIDRNQLKTFIAKRVPLSEAAEAHQMLEEGHTKGKIILTID